MKFGRINKIKQPKIKIDVSNYYVNTSKDRFIDLLKTDEKIILVDGPKRLKKKVTVVGFSKITAIDTRISVEFANGFIQDYEVRYWQ